MNSISKHAEIEKENDSIKVQGDKVGARVITVEIDAECAYEVLCDLYEELKDDNRIPKLIKKYGKLMEEYVADTSFEGALQENLGGDEDDDITDIILEAYDDALDEMDTLIDDAEDALDDDGTKIVIEMATKKSSSTLMAFNVAVKAGGEKVEVLDVQLGKNGVAKSDKITVDVMGEYVAEFVVKQNDKDAYKCEFVLEESEQEVLNVFAKIDRAGGKFTFGASAEGETFELTGKYDKSGKTHTFDFKDVVLTDSTGEVYSMADMWVEQMLDAEVDIDIEVKLIIRENDTPKPIAKNKLKSAFALDEEDFDEMQIAFEELEAELKAAFESIIENNSESATEETAAEYPSAQPWDGK